ncbi:hypothetical protein WJX84_004785 [Apatococcus fuscideae]|uniref:Uncharacterized protein n=1 Tax=Apatococcus fuscideae TaxID=2026836 RepID=A0AAW1SRA5_9CHLO
MASELQAPVATSFQLSGRKRNLQPLAVQGTRSQQETSQAVTAFSGGRVQDSEGRPAVAPGKKVIPKLENTFKAGPRQHDPNRYLPEQSDGIPASTEERFELAVAEPEIEVDLHFPVTNETVDNVQQLQLETVIPRKEGSRVLILAGPSKGQKAWLLKRNSESGAAAVRPTMDPDCILRLPFDSISEYVGAMGEEE